MRTPSLGTGLHSLLVLIIKSFADTLRTRNEPGEFYRSNDLTTRTTAGCEKEESICKINKLFVCPV